MKILTHQEITQGVNVHVHIYSPINSGYYTATNYFGTNTDMLYSVYQCTVCNHKTVESDLAKYYDFKPKASDKITFGQFQAILREASR